VDRLTAGQIARLGVLAERAARHLDAWEVPDPEHQARIIRLRRDWVAACELLRAERLTGDKPLDQVMEDVADQSCDVQELMVALLLEPFGDLVDGLTECMADPFGALAPPLRDTGMLRARIEADFHWALEPDYDRPDNCRQFWYVSAAKQEPRLGDRFAEDGASLESPLDIARRVKALHRDLPAQSQPMAAFLAGHPQHGLAAARVALSQRYPYAEIQDNLIAQTCLPIDMLRCKLAFFGASRFDPKSDLWTRITLCQGAPLADELGADADDWWLPVFAQ